MSQIVNKYKNFTASTSAVKNGPGNLIGVFVNSTTAGTLKIYDSLTQTGAVMNNTTQYPAVGYYPLGGASFGIGLSVTVGGTIDATLYYE